MTRSFWDFTNWNSIWPLPHVLLAYHAYMYGRSWMTVLCYYYLAKAVQLLLFSLFNGEHADYFVEILYFDASTNHPRKIHQAECAVDFNGLFLGGTVQTLMGILLGVIHTKISKKRKEKRDVLNYVGFWKEDEHSDSSSSSEAEGEVERASCWWFRKRGLWPWWSICGGMGDSEQSAWAFRERYWRRALQLFLLGTPALVFYGLDSEGDIRAGTVLYGLVTCCLLLIYKHWNHAIHLTCEKNAVLRDVENGAILGWMEIDERLASGAHENTYCLWIFTCAFVISFQAIPDVSSFWKVVIAVGVLGAGSCVLLLCRGAEERKRKREKAQINFIKSSHPFHRCL